MASSKGLFRHAILLLLSSSGLGIFGACGGSTTVRSNCNRGDTLVCVGERQCEGSQTCLEDNSGFGPCVCEPSGVGGVSGSGTGGSGATVGGNFGAGGSSAGTAGASTTGGTGGVLVDGGSCASVRMQAKQTPLDMFILLDQSGSMLLFGEDRWTPVVNAIKTFIATPEMAGVGVGLGYFGLHPAGQPPLDPSAPGSCNASDYARPEVAIDVLPNVRQAIENSLALHTPGGGTPTHPALEGALQYAATWALAHPDRKTIIVLATDGEPQGCTGNDVTTVSGLAAAGAAMNPPINTYVIGIGPSLQALNQIAQAGSSNQAYLVDPGNTQPFLAAMKQVHRKALGCGYPIPPGPPGTMLDIAKLNLLHTSQAGVEQVIYYVSSAADCRPDTGGWYVERDSQGTVIEIALCPVSCQAVADGGGTIDFALGCAPKLPP